MHGFRCLEGTEADLTSLGVFLSWDGVSQLHTGFVVRDEKGIFQYHLAWHYRFRVDEVKSPQELYWEKMQFLRDKEEELMFSGFLTAVKNLNSSPNETIPYGLKFDGSPFDDDGNYIETGLGLGLTCSTFVLAICSHLDFPAFLKFDTWPENDPKDERWQEKIICTMYDQHKIHNEPSEEHILASMDAIGCRRFRPAQVAAAVAAATADLPLDHSEATARGMMIVDGAFGKSAAEYA